MSYKANVIIEKDSFGYFASCPALDGCHSQGDTLEELLQNIREAIELYFETLSRNEIEMLASQEMI